MTCRPSSISASEAWRYLAAVALMAAAGLAAAWLLTAYGYQRGLITYHFLDLLEVQKAKIAAHPEAETVFVGDSSLGNAIDAAHWAERTGRPTLNLALTGVYGYAGSLNMVRRVLKNGHPRTIVVFHTLDVAARPTPYMGFVHTYDGWLPLAEVPVTELARAYFNYQAALGTLKGLLRGGARPKLPIVDDYVAQGPPLAPERIAQGGRGEKWTGAAINPANLGFLKALAETCRAAGVRCIYAHGPLAEPACRRMAPYAAALNVAVVAAGLELATPEPVCMPAEDVGDSPDHVRPGRKRAFTERYLDLLGTKALDGAGQSG
ncbi:MAG: hypothetical protein ACM31L_16865 [Actinomycetota bacterium]